MGCPLCRTRISSWARSAVRSKTLVDEELWEFIKRTFPLQVESAQAGKDIIDPEEVFPCLAVHQLADPGEIKSEFDSQLERTREEEREKREREELLSSELAGRMEEEERERLEAAEKQEAADRELARKIRMETNSTPSSSKKRRNPVLDLLKKSAEKKAKLTRTVETAGAAKEDSDVDMNWDEDFLEEQREMERRLDQEKEDRDLARKLQSQMPSSSSEIKSSKRQLSLMDFSSKESEELSSCRLQSPRGKQDKENNTTEDVSAARDLKILQKKIESDLSIKVDLVPDTDIMKSEEVKDQISKDKELALQLQEQLKKEGSKTSSNRESDGGGVKNVFQILSESQKSQRNSAICKNRHNHRSVPCRSCANCVKANCGVCTSCRDMPQFGGKGKSKQSCIQRKCLRPHESKCSYC